MFGIRNISADYDQILKNSFDRELAWFETEFDFLFSRHFNCSKSDITLAQELIANLKETLKPYDMNHLVTEFLDKLKSRYPEFF